MRGIQICAYCLLVDSVDSTYIHTMQSKGFNVEGVDSTYIHTMQSKGLNVEPVDYIKKIQIKICSYLETVDTVNIKEMKPIQCLSMKPFKL